MSKRFQRFIEEWVGRNVRPSSMDSYERGADELLKLCLEVGTKQGFLANELAEEKAFIASRIATALATDHIPDLGNMRGGDD